MKFYCRNRCANFIFAFAGLRRLVREHNFRIHIQPKDMTEAEKEQCRMAISDYKRICDVVQHGNLYRLQSPYDNKGVASLMYVSENRDKVVLFGYKTETFAGQKLPPAVLAGLAPDNSYKITELTPIDVVPQVIYIGYK